MKNVNCEWVYSLFNDDYLSDFDGVDKIPLFGTEKFINADFDQIKTVSATCFMAMHIVNGTGHFNLALETYQLEPNSVYYVYPGQLISKVQFINCEGYVIYSNTQSLLKSFPDFLSLNIFQMYGERHHVLLEEGQNEKLKYFIELLLNEKESHSSTYTDIAIRETLTKLHILYTDQIFEQSSVQLSNPYPDKLKEFFSLLNFRQNTQLKVSDYASQLNISPNYLNSIVKKRIGKSVKTILKEKVIRKACVLLIHTNLEVKEIAFQLGYNYSQYFNRDFKTSVNKTPLEYRSERKA